MNCLPAILGFPSHSLSQPVLVLQACPLFTKTAPVWILQFLTKYSISPSDASCTVLYDTPVPGLMLAWWTDLHATAECDANVI